METIYQRVAGLDIHQKNIVACLRKTGSDGSVEEDIRTFDTMTDDLLTLCDWLSEQQVTHVAMESTGVLWKPIWNILEGYDFELQLVNARELKQVPGRKSDVKDCQWIAHLLACGLLKSSFVPEKGQRQLRDLTRHRAQLHGEHTRCANRIHKVLQDANIKLSSVATDILGKSGRSHVGRVGGRSRRSGSHGRAGSRKVAEKDSGAEAGAPRARDGAPSVHAGAVVRATWLYWKNKSPGWAIGSQRHCALFWMTRRSTGSRAIPGVNRVTIENVVAEMGVEMSQFPSAEHLASWAGLCPGNEESAGKRKRTPATKGNVWLRRALCEAAWAAGRSKDTYFAAQYRRLAGRRGKNRAVMAVAHSLLVVFYHLLNSERLQYRELGGNYFDTLDLMRLRRHLVKRLESLGYEVTLAERKAA